MKLIIDTDSVIKGPNFVMLEQPQFVYISGVSCIVPKMNRVMNDVFFIIKKDNYIYNYLFEHDESINEKNQILIIKKEYYKSFGIPSFDEEAINRLLIRSMFESITQVKNPMYMLVSLINCLGSDGYVSNKHSILDKIKTAIMDNIHNCDFNLKRLCDLVYMSRRKIQYILSSYNESFLTMLHSFRIEKLKQLINEKPKIFISELIYLAGFNSYQTANRLFKQYVGVSINQYRESKLYLLD